MRKTPFSCSLLPLKNSTNKVAARSFLFTSQKCSPFCTSLNAHKNNKKLKNKVYSQKRCFSGTTHAKDVANGTNAQYLEEIEKMWQQDPSSVDPSWSQYFQSLRDGTVPTMSSEFSYTKEGTQVSHTDSELKSNIVSLVRAFQVSGHHIANLDPLGLNDADLDNSIPPELEIKNYNFSEQDYDKEVYLGGHMMKGFLAPGKSSTTLRKIIENLQQTYCSSIGWEYMHILNREQCNWLRERIEIDKPYEIDSEERIVILERLMFSDSFEKFLANKWPTSKRFGLEGCESLIPGMKSMIDTAVNDGIEGVVIGMPHRGRLNVLANVMRKPLEKIFSEFQGTNISSLGSGDVKYHLGMSISRPTRGGKLVDLSLVPNPSHLEAVDPVVEGKTRAKQFISADETRKKYASILLHGDAAFAGQGVVYETMGFSGLQGYTTGGTIHIIVNNQIGFTTNPRQSRSSPYCTDLAKYISAPIFHVNGDDMDAVIRVMNLAAEWRQTFNKDVIVDIVCYRKHGHNELDQPMFTQPKMYTVIAKHQSILDRYVEKLLKEGIITKEKVSQMQDEVKKILEEAYARSRNQNYESNEWLAKEWSSMKSPKEFSPIRATGVKENSLKLVGGAISSYPESFNIHPVLKRIMGQRKDMIETGKNIDWGTAEALAFGTLLNEGTHIRLSGQDCERGTFSHRHAVLVDQKTEERYIPLNNISPNQQIFHVHNSHLSEFGVLGFEYGYSIETPNHLVLWEAQFGDFANGAQIIIDQFISCAEPKWLRSSGLVMLLPHGYEGQGPEHSNARYERFLQLSDEDPFTFPSNLDENSTKQIQLSNWQVVNCTTPANYFHALRRQIYRDFRKPLIVMTPKSLLRYKHATSTLGELSEGTRFKPVIPEVNDDQLLPADKIKRVVFCSGKVYYDLWTYRQEKEIKDVAIVRIEQMAPFPFYQIAQQFSKYPNAEVMWCQEEPCNYGAFYHFYTRAITTLKHLGIQKEVKYAGRDASSSPATGLHNIHNIQQQKLVETACRV